MTEFKKHELPAQIDDMLMEDNCLAIMSMAWPMVVLGTGPLVGEEIDADRAEGYVLNDGPADGGPACPTLICWRARMT